MHPIDKRSTTTGDAGGGPQVSYLWIPLMRTRNNDDLKSIHSRVEQNILAKL